jgi:hypothetical protein
MANITVSNIEQPKESPIDWMSAGTLFWGASGILMLKTNHDKSSYVRISDGQPMHARDGERGTIVPNGVEVKIKVQR